MVKDFLFVLKNPLICDAFINEINQRLIEGLQTKVVDLESDLKTVKDTHKLEVSFESQSF